MRRVAIALLTIGVGLSAAAKDLYWQDLDSLPLGDRQLAERTLYEMWGDNPAFWPDWIHPAALYVPTAGDRLLIVRRPLHAPCGQYGFAVFGPVTAERRRDQIGDFCAGQFAVLAVPGRDWPDLLVAEGREPDQAGQWHRKDQRLRWRDGQWWRISSP